MAELEWHFPWTVDEAVALLSREGTVPHAGGTGILRAGTARLRGLVDIAGLGLDFATASDGVVRLGAGSTYAAAARFCAGRDHGHVLVRSLGEAATTPLRNRITIGGSVAQFPFWSDLAGPLLALDASVELAGGAGGIWPFRDHVARKELRQGTLVTAVRFAEDAWRSAYYRHTRTNADHPAFTITALVRLADSTPARVADARIVVTGCAGRYKRLVRVEERIRGQDPRDLPRDEDLGSEELSFSARMGFSAEYLGHCARVELGRTIRRAAGG